MVALDKYVATTEAFARMNHQYVDKYAHLICGFAIWLLVAMVFRRPMDHWLPLSAPVLAGLVNEIIEVIVVPTWSVGDSIADLFATVAIPVIVSISMRLVPAIRG